MNKTNGTASGEVRKVQGKVIEASVCLEVGVYDLANRRCLNVRADKEKRVEQKEQKEQKRVEQ